MIVRKQLCAALSLLVAVAVGFMTGGPAAAAFDTGDKPQFQPYDRGAAREPGNRDREPGQSPPETSESTEDEPEDPCPTQRWTIPLEIEGLLCVLVLEIPEEEPAPSSVASAAKP